MKVIFLPFIAMLSFGQDQAGLREYFRIVKSIPRTTKQAVRDCPELLTARIGFCRISADPRDLLGTPGAVGAPYEAQGQLVRWRQARAVDYAAAISVNGTVSLVWARAGKIDFSSGNNSFHSPDKSYVIVSLAQATSWSRNQQGFLACVRTNRELDASVGKAIFAELAARFGPQLVELRIRQDAWFLDVDFALRPVEFAAWNSGPLPTKATLEQLPSVLCHVGGIRREVSCSLLKGLAYERR